MNFGDTPPGAVEDGLHIGTSAYGRVLPVVYGTNRVAGNVIWMPHSLWVKEAGSSGKGGDTSTGNRYWQGLSIAICEGPLPLGAAGISRVFGDKDVYTSIADWQDKTGSSTIELHTGARTQTPSTIPGSPNLNKYSYDPTLALINGQPWGARSVVLSQPEAAAFTQILDVTVLFQAFGSAGQSGLVHLMPTATVTTTPGANQYSVSAGPNPTLYVNIVPSGAVAWDRVLHIQFEYDQAVSAEGIIGYGGTVYVICKKLSLGNSNSLKNYSFEVNGFLTGGGAGSVNPADIIQDFLTNTEYGAEWPASQLETVLGQDGTAASGYKRYCDQMGFLLSPIFDSQKSALDQVDWILQATNSAILNSGGKLKIVPLGDVTVGTYTPYTTATPLNQDDFMGPINTDPITVSRVADADTYNCYPVEFVEPLPQTDQDSAYNVSVVEEFEQGNVEMTGGVRKASVVSLKCITVKAVAQAISRIMAQRSCYVRNTYKFQLGWKYALLEPLDLITITDPVSGLNGAQARIIAIDEDEAGTLSVEAEEWPFGIAHATAHATQTGDGGGQQFSKPPLVSAAPAIALAPIDATANAGVTPELWIATAPGSKDWGGAQVWLSWDNATYLQVGDIQACTYGVVGPTVFPLGPAFDTTNTLSVDLRISTGVLTSVTAVERDAYVSLCYVDGELLSYQTATLTATSRYNLSSLQRGLFGSPIATHSAQNSLFIRVDSKVLRLPIDTSRYGQTVFVKLLSYNLSRSRVQALSDASVYSYQVPTQVQAQSGAPAPLKLSFEDFNVNDYTVQFAGTSLTNPRTGKVGGNVLEMTGTNQLIHKTLIPYDENKYYKLACTYRVPQNMLILSQKFDGVRSNLISFSEQFDNAAWGKLNATITANAITAPDGLATADQFNEGVVASAQHFLRSTPTVPAELVGEIRCYSVFVKAGTLPNIQIRRPYGNNTGINFNLSTGVIDSLSGLTSSILSSGVQILSSGWYRVWFSVQVPASDLPGTTDLLIAGCGAAYATSYTGTSRTFYVWGAMCESVANAAGPSDYIPTPSSSAVYASWTPAGTSVWATPQLAPGTARTNLVLWSEQLDNAAWTKTNVTITANPAVIDPMGFNRQFADRVTLTIGNVAHYVGAPGTAVVRTGTFTASGYAQPGTVSSIWVELGGGAAGVVQFNLSTGVATIIAGAVTYIFTQLSGGWWRWSVTFTVAAASTSVVVYFGAYGAFNAAGTETVLLYGHQLEQSPTPTTYIATTTVAVAQTDVPAPDNSATAFMLNDDTGFGRFFQLFQSAGAGSTQYTYSIWLKDYTGPGGALAVINVWDQDASLSIGSVLTTAVTSSWQRFSISVTVPENHFFRVQVYPCGGTGAGAGSIKVWGAQLEYQQTALAASQYTPTVWQPRTPLYDNLLLWSNDLNNAAWVKGSGITIITSTQTPPDLSVGQAVSDSTPAGTLKQTISTIFTGGAVTVTFTVWVNRQGAGCVGSIFLFDLTGFSTLATTVVDTTAPIAWNRYSVTATVPTGHSFQAVISVPLAGAFAIWHPQVNMGSVPTPYVETRATNQIAWDHVAFFGFVGYQADGLTPVSVVGTAVTYSAHYLFAAPTNADGQWHTLIGYMHGRGGAGGGTYWAPTVQAPGVAETTVRYMRLLMYLNNPAWSNVGSFTDGVIDVDNVALTEIDEGHAYTIGASYGGSNLLINSQFEDPTGALNGWIQNAGGGTFTTAAGDATNAKYGTTSAKFIQTGFGFDSYYYQRYALVKPNTYYTFSAWYYLDSFTGPAFFSRAILMTDGVGNTVENDSITYTTTTGVWTRLIVTLTTGASPSYIECRIYGPLATIHWDGCQLEEGGVATAYAPRTDEILPNSSPRLSTAQITLTYGTTIATDASLGNSFLVIVTNGVAFTMSNPTNLATGQRVMYTFKNTSGGAQGAITWGATFKVAAPATGPAAATGNSRSIEFVYNGTNLIEIWRSTIDVPN